MHSGGMIDTSFPRIHFDASGKIGCTMATPRNLQHASGPARVIVTTDAPNCQRAIVD